MCRLVFTQLKHFVSSFSLMNCTCLTSRTLAAADMSLLKPPLFRQLSDWLKNLEIHFRDCVEVEFTIENDTLYFLEVKVAKRSPHAAMKIALVQQSNIFWFCLICHIRT